MIHVPGYQCLPLQRCDTSEVLISKDDAPVLDIRQSSIDIDHNNSPCQADDEICCKPAEPKTKAPTVDVPKYKPKCGQHHPDGIAIRISNSEEGNESTQFAEWPHVCLLHTINSLGSKEFLGGASLIAPGVVITTAHKVE